MDEILLMELLESDSDTTESESSDTETSTSGDEDLELFEYYFQLEEDLLLSGLQFYKNKRLCTRNFFEELVPLYNDEEFLKHFHVTRDMFKDLCTKFEMSDEYQKLRPDKRGPADKHIALFLWFAAHECCNFRELNERFQLSLFSVGKALDRVTNFLCSLSPNVIKWPDNDKKKVTSDFFLSKEGFPNVIGIIGSTNIIINCPATRKDDYVDENGVYSICLQVICNEKKKFMSIFVGFPGSCHDSWVFQNSPITPKLRSLCRGYYLLGDSAYPCEEYLLTPYKDKGDLSSAQKKYNKSLNSCRVVIEHTFQILKQRFRQLYHCKLRGITKLCDFVVACCVLHNLCDVNDMKFEIENPPAQTQIDEDIFEEEAEKRIKDRVCKGLK